MLTIADKGSTLDGISWPILGALLLAVVVAIAARGLWRTIHEANRERRAFNRDKWWHE